MASFFMLPAFGVSSQAVMCPGGSLAFNIVWSLVLVVASALTLMCSSLVTVASVSLIDTTPNYDWLSQLPEIVPPADALPVETPVRMSFVEQWQRPWHVQHCVVSARSSDRP